MRQNIRLETNFQFCSQNTARKIKISSPPPPQIKYIYLSKKWPLETTCPLCGTSASPGSSSFSPSSLTTSSNPHHLNLREHGAKNHPGRQSASFYDCSLNLIFSGDSTFSPAHIVMLSRILFGNDHSFKQRFFITVFPVFKWHRRGLFRHIVSHNIIRSVSVELNNGREKPSHGT